MTILTSATKQHIELDIKLAPTGSLINASAVLPTKKKRISVILQNSNILRSEKNNFQYVPNYIVNPIIPTIRV